jgi:malonyl-CoA O-methyltransferase
MMPDYRLDKSKIKRSFAAAADSYDNLAGLQRQAGLTLLEKFPLDSSPGAILDVGCGTGFLTRNMAVDVSSQPLLALDIAWPMLFACRQRNLELPVQYLCADAEKMPFAAHSLRQIYSNLALQWCQDLPAVFTDCKRMLKVGGQLVFATFGPETLRELKAAWAAVDGFAHVNEFYGIHQINRFLQEAGFHSISADTTVYRSAYPSVMALMLELKGIGAHNVNLDRNRRPTTRRQLQRMIACYESNMDGAELVASYEIIFVRARR